MPLQREVAEVHAELKAAVAAWERAERNVVVLFAEFLRGRLYRELGYPDMSAYARAELGFSRSRVSHLLSLVQAMDRMPALATAVRSGELEWSKASDLARHATPESAPAWVEVAKTTSRRQLRERLREARRGQRAAEPVAQLALETDVLRTSLRQSEPLPVMTEIRLAMTPVQLARYEEAMAKLRRKGCSQVELILEAMELAAASGANASPDQSTPEPVRRRNTPPPTLLIIHRCPNCQQDVVRSERGDRRLTRRQSEAETCDATLQRDGARRTRIPPRLRRRALERDQHRCAGCARTSQLQVHHIEERSQGGTHALDNLLTLCRPCHQQWHAGWRSAQPHAEEVPMLG